MIVACGVVAIEPPTTMLNITPAVTAALNHPERKTRVSSAGSAGVQFLPDERGAGRQSHRGTARSMQRHPIALPSAPLIAGFGAATAYPTPKYAAIARARLPGGKTALVIASERPMRNANVMPAPARPRRAC